MAPASPPQPSADELLAHADWLGRLARALVGEAGAADLVQDTYEVALRQPPRADGPLRPWLGGVLRNVARMRARGGARRQRREDAVAPAGDAPSPEELVARVETQQLVARVVLELDEPVRSTLLLRYFEGLSAADIARAQGVPAGTVRWRLKQALDQVRARLDDAHAGDRRRWALMLAPLAAARGGAPAGLLLKGIAVKTSVKVAVVVVTVLALVVTSRLLGWWGGGATPPPTAPVADAAPAAPPPPPHIAGRVAGDEARLVRDDDPAGPLRLEGQVIDADDQPVGGARVAIDSAPVRVVETEADGSFVFEGLLPRDYRLEATAGDGYAGPARLRLAPDAEPVTLRLRPAGVLEVAVTVAGTHAPVAGAEVELRATLTWQGVTGADGVATLRGVGPVWGPLVVRAAGFSPAGLIASPRGDPDHPDRIEIVVGAGAAVAGRVVDDDGAPIADARVAILPATEPFPVFDPRRDGVVTGADGTFAFPSVAAGTWRVVAAEGDHAPAASAPLVLDGRHPRDGVELRLERGAVLVGRVVDGRGVGVAAADVHLLGRGFVYWRLRRQAVTDGDGRFRIAGLPRRAVEVAAWHPDGASAVVEVDLAAARQQEVTLALEVTGAIAGVVVDAAGQPIGDAQVLAEPRWTGNVGEREAWQVRGVQQTVTDQAGRFRFAGLPDGDYRLHGARPDAGEGAVWLGPEVAAHTGAGDARLVLPSDGRIVGLVATPDGAPVTAFTVSIDAAAAVPVAPRDGRFSIPVPAGRHAVRVAGLGFAPTKVGAVDVPEGDVADLGTITVEPGRAVSGRVLDADGAPVVGAEVAAGRLLTGGGAELYIENESVVAQSTRTDEDGRFTMTGFLPAPITLVAGLDGVGRSASVTIPRGKASVEVDLVLIATGGVDGVITRDGQPLADTAVIANPVGATRSNFFVVTGPDGTFALDQLAAGSYVIYPMIGGGGNRPKDMYVHLIDVAAGARTAVTIDATPGPIALTVAARTDAGAPVTVAPVVVTQPVIAAPTMEALADGATLPPELLAGGTLTMYIRTIMGAPVEIAGVALGPHSVCVTPLPVGDDSSRAMALMDRVDQLPMKCVPYTVTAAPAAQTVTVEVPAAWAAPPATP